MEFCGFCCFRIRTKLQHFESLKTDIDRERKENADLKTKVYKFETEHNSYVSNEQELLGSNVQLKKQLNNASEDLRRAREELTQAHAKTDNVVAEHRANWVEERLNLQRRLDELENQAAQLHQKLNLAVTSHKKVRILY